MGLKQFTKDVSNVQHMYFEGVTGIRRGDSDGELVFCYSHNELQTPLEIQILFLDIELYPNNTSYMIFTTSDSVDAEITEFLGRLSVSIGQSSVQGVITAVSNSLTAQLNTGFSADSGQGDSVCEESEEGEEEDENSFFGDDDDDIPSDTDSHSGDDDFLGRRVRHGIQENIEFRPISNSVRRLKKDLLSAKSAGLSVGFLPKGKVKQAQMFSLSLRVAKLRIPEDALTAWDLKASEYIVLLCKFPRGYPSLAECLFNLSQQNIVTYRFGKCAKARPTFSSSVTAFRTTEHDFDTSFKTVSSESHDDDFRPIIVSNSVNEILNQDFFKLLSIRRSHGATWDAAHVYLTRLANRDSTPSTVPPCLTTFIQENLPGTADDTEFGPFPDQLEHDYAMDNEEEFSITLVSMQFALRRLTQCTQYCMVCHQRIKENVDALKPYVCSRSLCLFQLLSLGFGSSIEHEVVNHPYVVDLLVSFFCSALTIGSLREFPQGLGLKGALTGTLAQPAEHIVADICLATKMIKFDHADYPKYRLIKSGDSLLVVIIAADIATKSISLGGLERHLCRVETITNNTIEFETMKAQISSLNPTINLSEVKTFALASPPIERWRKVLVFRYSHDIDDLSIDDRSIALLLMTQAIPSVLEMKDFLLQNPGRRLSSWGRMERGSLRLLNWIVASNRSLILQDGVVPSDAEELLDPLCPIPGARDVEYPGKVQGMPGDYMQFRFLQGSPEKEREFNKELQLVEAGQGKEEPQRPATLFLWHGSPMSNWHSIVRTGLDFQTLAHGRSYGNGVYFSQHMNVSTSYSSMSGRRAPNAAMFPNELAWAGSVLRPRAALSVCEVINCPKKFISITPHLVVDKVAWIQCRYLFVRVQPTSSATEQPLPTPLSQEQSGYVQQDSNYHLFGKGNARIEIPLSAISLRRRHALANLNTSINYESQSAEPIEQESLISFDSDDSGLDAGLLTDSDDEVDPKIESGKRRRSTSQDSLSRDLGSSKPFKARRTSDTQMKVVGPAYQINKLESGFQPGTLDLDSLPKLPEPTWASSSSTALRSLNRAIREIQAIQAQNDLNSLGWFIDFDRMSNAFHWIVELHSFGVELPLAQDMKRYEQNSIVMELRFGSGYPFSPPFVRVVRPRFLPFAQGGGGHVTAGGAICSEMLTNSGWSPAMSIEKIFLQVRLGLCDLNPPARLECASKGQVAADYGIHEAIDAYTRAARMHGWSIPNDIREISSFTQNV